MQNSLLPELKISKSLKHFDAQIGGNMKDKLEKIRDNAHYSYRQLGVWQSSSAEDTKAIQKLKECVTLADSILAELDSPELVEKVAAGITVGQRSFEELDSDCQAVFIRKAQAAINAIKGTK